MSRNLFEEIGRSLNGVGVTDGVIMSGDKEMDTPPSHLSPEAGGKDPMKNAASRGSEEDDVKSKHQETMAYQKSDKKSMKSNFNTTERTNGEEMENDDDDIICPSPISFRLPGSSIIQPVKASTKQSMKRNFNTTERTNGEEMENDDDDIICPSPISFRLPGSSIIQPVKASTKQSMKSNFSTTERTNGEEMENNDDIICPSPILFRLPGSSIIQSVKASTKWGMKSQVGRSKKAKAENHEKFYKIYHPLPTSYCLPGTTTIVPMDSKKAIKRRYKELMEPLVQNEPRTLTMEERKKGYIQQTRVRRNGVTDKYHYHVETDQKFRSLKAVHEYILYGDQQHGSFSEKIYKGTTYLESQVIGRFNFKTKSIMPIEEQIDDSEINGDEEKMEEDTEDEFQGRKRTTFALPIGFYMNFELVKK